CVPASSLRCFVPLPSTTPLSTLSLHDALPIFEPTRHCPTQHAGRVLGRRVRAQALAGDDEQHASLRRVAGGEEGIERPPRGLLRSEEHTSELQSRENLVCRLLLEKKNKT